MVPLLPQPGQLIPARRARLNFTATHLYTGNAHFKGGHFPTKPGLHSPAPSLPGQGTKYALGLLSMQGPKAGTPHSAHANSRLRPHTGDSGKDRVESCPKAILVYSCRLFLSVSPVNALCLSFRTLPGRLPHCPLPLCVQLSAPWAWSKSVLLTGWPACPSVVVGPQN